MTTLRRTRTATRGQALVEFALTIPLLLLLTVGLFDFGRAIYAYNTISNAARAGNRVAIVDQNMTKVRQAALNEAPALDIPPANVAATFTCTDQIGCLATVRVAYDFTPATPVVSAIVGPITLHGQSQMPIERVWVSP
jgi:Flp pilus assembly protein TadG